MGKIGFVGLGAMGSRMASRLGAAGRPLVVWNRTRAKAEPLLERGMAWASSPRDLAESCEVTFSMVTDTGALRAVTEGEDGIVAGLGPGKVYVDISTVSPATSRELAARVTERGATMLDAPVSGSTVTLDEGNAVFMVGGDADAFERVRPLLLDIGAKAVHVGGNGQAVLLKVATNLQLAVQMLAFSEAVLLAERGGIPRDVAVDVMTSSVIASPMVKYRTPYLLHQLDEVMFDCSMMQKDMLLALEAGRQFEVPLPTTAITNEYLTAARGMGLGENDFAIVFEVLRRLAGADGNG